MISVLKILAYGMMNVSFVILNGFASYRQEDLFSSGPKCVKFILYHEEIKNSTGNYI